jgi:hypothetical protein
MDTSEASQEANWTEYCSWDGETRWESVDRHPGTFFFNSAMIGPQVVVQSYDLEPGLRQTLDAYLEVPI